MRVLYLTNNADRASTTVATEGWLKYLTPLGMVPVIASPRLGYFSDRAKSVGAESYRVDLPFPNWGWPLPYLASLWRLRQIVKHHKIELIHANEQDVYPISQHLARLCGLPVVVSVHFTMSREFCTWAFSGKRRPVRIFFLMRGSLEATRLGITGVVPEEDWAVLPNGLDLERFQPSEELRQSFRARHGLAGQVVIGAACFLRARKQLEHLFEAASRVKSPGLRVVVAGGPVPGEEAYGAELIRQGKEKLGDRLLHLGHQDELRGLYNALDLFVNTSQAEACSISIIEALACGCPVVGYPSISVDDQVLPTGGEIVEQDRSDLLACALERWLADPAALRAARARARGRAEEAFDIRRLSDQLWAEYQTVLGRRGERR